MVEGVGAQVLDEDESQNQELTTHKVTIEVVTPVDDGHDVMGLGVAFLVEVHVNRRKTDKRCLSSFNHGQPDKVDPQHNEGDDGVRFSGNFRTPGKDDCHHDDSAENQQESRVDISENFSWGTHDGSVQPVCLLLPIRLKTWIKAKL